MSLGAIKIDMAYNIFGVLIVVVERGINILKLALGDSHNSNPMVMKGITNFFWERENLLQHLCPEKGRRTGYCIGRHQHIESLIVILSISPIGLRDKIARVCDNSHITVYQRGLIIHLVYKAL